MPAVLSGSLSIVLPQIELAPDGELLPFFRYAGIPSSTRWDCGALVGTEESDGKHALVYRVDREGEVERIFFAIPDSGFVQVRAIAGSPDRSLLLTGQAYDPEGRLPDLGVGVEGPAPGQGVVVRAHWRR
jgi:hypothetical protein